MTANHKFGRSRFNTFTIASAAAVSDEYELNAADIFNVLGLVIDDAWTTADIAFEVQFQHETTPVWRRVDYRGAPVLVQTPIADNLAIAEPEMMVGLRLPITKIRLRSVDPVLYTDILQAAARTIRVYMTE